MADGERREFLKPILFTGGVGQMHDAHTAKGLPEPGMLVIKLGGPAYRIGMGGGAASSMVQGENKAELDFNAVQRGDAEMEQKTNRVIRCCTELGAANPIISIHDQGAGGNCNVLKEIVEHPEGLTGGRFDIRKVLSGDSSLSVLELWGAEYQENDGILIAAERLEQFRAICEREKAPFSVVGEVTGDGRVVVVDGDTGDIPVDLELAKVLGELPRKTFTDTRPPLAPSAYPVVETTVANALDKVLRLMQVRVSRQPRGSAPSPAIPIAACSATSPGAPRGSCAGRIEALPDQQGRPECDWSDRTAAVCWAVPHPALELRGHRSELHERHWHRDLARGAADQDDDRPGSHGPHLCR